jgi:hypothetical protein
MAEDFKTEYLLPLVSLPEFRSVPEMLVLLGCNY